MDKISWTDRVRHEEVLHRVKKKGNILLTINSTKANWFGYNLSRNCFLKHVIEGRIDVTRRRGIRCRQILADFKKTK
jgi:hypothetical protein